MTKKTIQSILLLILILFVFAGCASTSDEDTSCGDKVAPGIPEDQGVMTNNPFLIFTWTAAEDCENQVVGYDLQIGSAIDGNDLFDEYVEEGLSKSVEGSAGLTYYARVRAVKTDGAKTDWTDSSDGILIDPVLADPDPTSDASGDDYIKQIWSYDTGGLTRSSFAVEGDMVFIMNENHKVFAFKQATGELVWEKEVPNGGRYESLTTADNMLMYGGQDGMFYAFQADTGDLLWTFNTEIDVVWRSAVSDGKVYVPTTQVWNDKEFVPGKTSKLFALDLQTGAKQWEYENGTYYLHTPEIQDGILYLGGSFEGEKVEEGGHLRMQALDIAACEAGTCTPEWTYESEDGRIKSMYVNNNIVSFLAYTDFVYGINITSGEQSWEFYTGNWSSSFRAFDGVIYIGSANNSMYGVDNDNGKTLWRHKLRGPYFNHILGSPWLVEDNLYFMTIVESRISALNKDNGAAVWDFEAVTGGLRTELMVDNGLAFMAEPEGIVRAFDLLEIPNAN